MCQLNFTVEFGEMIDKNNDTLCIGNRTKHKWEIAQKRSLKKKSELDEVTYENDEDV